MHPEPVEALVPRQQAQRRLDQLTHRLAAEKPVLLVALCQLAPETFVGDSIAGTYSEKLVDTVGNRWRVVLGAEASEEVERVFQRAQTKQGIVR